MKHATIGTSNKKPGIKVRVRRQRGERYISVSVLQTLDKPLDRAGLIGVAWLSKVQARRVRNALDDAIRGMR